MHGTFVIKDLLKDTRVTRLLVANTLGSIGSGVTIFSVPWILVHQPGGSASYRWITIATTIALFLFMPYYGAWIDRHSRKTALLTSEAWGFCATLTMALLGLALGGFASWQLMTIYFCGMLYYTLHYPAKFALIQQIFVRSQYQSLIGLIEIQGQTAMMIAGGLGGYLVEHVPLWVILLIDSCTYLTSFLIQSTISYEATHLKPAALDENGEPVKRPTVWQSIALGWAWLRDRPKLTIFLTCSFIPFILVMAGNYLFPVYVAQTLHASASWFAGGEIAFATGAILAGALLPRLLAQRSAASTIPGTMIVFLLGLVMIIALRFPLTYLMASVMLGFGNAGCRVARNALMLNIVPNEMMGRVGGFYSVFDRVLRTLLVSSMGVIEIAGPPAGFAMLLIVLIVALVGVLQSRAALKEFVAATPVPAPAAAAT